MADACIICLEALDEQPSESQLHSGTLEGDEQQPSPATAPGAGPAPAPQPSAVTTPETKLDPTNSNEDNRIAVIDACGHSLHDVCLREWTGKANSCPICRQAFHLVHVYDTIGGTQISSYKVEDKKQVAEFDPQAWLDENVEEEEESRPCPICNESGNEDVLLLCDSCDAPYHTYCVGLNGIPRGHWFCMECGDTAAELLAAEVQDPEASPVGVVGFSDGRSDYLPRTQGRMRRARQRARSDEWQGAWGQIAGHVFNVLNLDLDNHDDDEALQNYRRSQQRRERERREYQRWQRRLNIASRLGARDVFTNNLPNLLPQPVRERQPPPPPPQETQEERAAWGALEKAMEAGSVVDGTPNRRKRKSRSVTASPVEPPPREPERKLKRPRTRRVQIQSEAGPSSRPLGGLSSDAGVPQTNGSAATSNAPSPPPNNEAPTFLSSLLKEVEMSTTSDDEVVQSLFARPAPNVDPSSPVSSPGASSYNTPRALSITPPPRGPNERSCSPVLTLSSRIEPIYPRANYSPNRASSGSEHSDSEHRSSRANGARPSLELRHPRPRRQQPVQLPKAEDASPTRVSLPLEMKESITSIVKDALRPHWKSGKLTSDQYAVINRDLSHKLYDNVAEKASLDDEARQLCEKVANKEVARAVAELKA